MVVMPIPLDDDFVVAAFPEFSVETPHLGEGAFKKAYRGRRGPEEIVLKVLRQPLPEPDADTDTDEIPFPERVQRELQAMTTIDHPRVVRILHGPDVRSVGGSQRIWYLEPHYRGGTLDQRMQHPWSDAETRNLLLDLLASVEVLAEHNLVHRDIKPANIAFDGEDRPVLLDLGIVLDMNQTRLTSEHLASPRTDRYAAPEQFENRLRVTIDFRTDLFLLGLVAFEVRTGSHPFNPNEPVGYLERLCTGQYDAEALDRAVVDPDLAGVLVRLIAAAPNQRYRKLGFVREALGGAS